ncbi:MAG: carboxypeptidase-like regulatory domain-containing protein, partial [Clostridia bacterium]|nr:carboxypeptidase-like regulatory domain-containing protein [Clostridia bacterium]
MPKYVLCPRCELNYIQEGEEYCDVCKAELKKGPQLVFAVDDEEEQEIMELCPKCHQNYLKPGQTLCRQCAKLSQYEDEKTDLDDEDESWKEYLDNDETEDEDEDSEEMLSLAKLAEEEGEELFDDEEEEEIEIQQDSEPDGLTLLCVLSPLHVLSQIKGKVVDAETGEPVPYANVYYQKQKTIGTNTSLNGRYTLQSPPASDTIVFSFVGYKTHKLYVERGAR